MGMAGAPFPYYIGYVEPSATFGLPYAVNSIAMPMIGGTTSWVGPADRRHPARLAAADRHRDHLLGVNLLIVGVLLVGFVIIAPKGIVGLVQDWRQARAKP